MVPAPSDLFFSIEIIISYLSNTIMELQYGTVANFE